MEKFLTSKVKNKFAYYGFSISGVYVGFIVLMLVVQLLIEAGLFTNISLLTFFSFVQTVLRVGIWYSLFQVISQRYRGMATIATKSAA